MKCARENVSFSVQLRNFSLSRLLLRHSPIGCSLSPVISCGHLIFAIEISFSKMCLSLSRDWRMNNGRCNLWNFNDLVIIVSSYHWVLTINTLKHTILFTYCRINKYYAILELFTESNHADQRTTIFNLFTIEWHVPVILKRIVLNHSISYARIICFIIRGHVYMFNVGQTSPWLCNLCKP